MACEYSLSVSVLMYCAVMPISYLNGSVFSGAFYPHVGGGMTGSGGGISYTPSESPCESFRATTILNSPDPIELAKLNPGDCLDIIVQKQGSFDVVTAVRGGQTVGTVTSSSFIRLNECLRDGVPFCATVKSIVGGRCTVEISQGTCS